jgi:Uma2 family endonuclease
MSQLEQAPATLADLLRETGKAELIGGRIVQFMPTGFLPNRIAGRIFRSLDEYADRTGRGIAGTDNLGYTVPALPSGRQSFAPDASYYDGPLPENPMRFIPRAPTLAVEVRSENDYGEDAEGALAAKRADYFAAGTLVVWDVDPLDECIRAYDASNPNQAVVYRRGQVAEVASSLPGWEVSVDWIFQQ